MSRPGEKIAGAEGPRTSLAQKAEAIATAWVEARLVYPLYSYLATHFNLSVPPVHETSLSPACPASDVFEKVVRWLDAMDSQIRTNQLRQLLHSIKDLKPECLRALILRLLRRTQKTPTDRDNVDLLLATYFALCAPEDLYSCEITLSDVAQVLRSVLADADPAELEWCAPLNQVLEAMKQSHGLGQVFAAKLLEKGRELKDAAGFMFYDPAALVAFTRFNFLARRSFFRLLHADLRAIREGLTELERRGIFAVDCRSAGLGMQEPTAHLREISLSWRQPVSADYADGSANRTFEQLLAIRAAVEKALGIAPQEVKLQISSTEEHSVRKTETARPSPLAVMPIQGTSQAMRQVFPASSNSEQKSQPRSNGAGSVKPDAAHIPSGRVAEERTQANSPVKEVPLRSAQPPTTAAKAAETRTVALGEKKSNAESNAARSSGDVLSLPLEKCLENIWEQLIEAPPSRGRSMSTVTLGDARILLSAWEVNAFVSDGGQLSEDLRRAVAARALIAMAREEHKTSGNRQKLDDCIALGRDEMKYLQRRVDEAQRAKDTDAAVNLGISARRLLSAMEEAQK